MDFVLIRKLEEWQAEGNRAVKISLDILEDEKPKIWAYDYDLKEGVFVYSVEDIPTTESLKAKIRSKLQAQLEQLDN